MGFILMTHIHPHTRMYKKSCTNYPAVGSRAEKGALWEERKGWRGLYRRDGGDKENRRRGQGVCMETMRIEEEGCCREGKCVF